MKSKQLTQNLPAKLLGLCLTVLCLQSVGAQTWTTVLDYQYVTNKNSEAFNIVADTLGNVFCGGYGFDALGVNHGLVLQTDTNAINWYLSEDTNPYPTNYPSYIINLGLDASNNVYSIGSLFTNNSSEASDPWYVRKGSPNSNGGLTWSTVDDYPNQTGQQSGYAYGFAADDTTNIYVVGHGISQTIVVGSGKHPTTTTNIQSHWLVRKSTDGGSSWTNVDDEFVNPGLWPRAAAFVKGAGIFVVGFGDYWIVRRSSNGEPGSWLTVDGPFGNGAACTVCSDSLTNIYVSGSQFIATGVVKTKGTTVTYGYDAWITRMSSDGGTTWTTVDTYSYPGALNYSYPDALYQGAGAGGSGRDSAGNVIVVGGAIDALNQQHWIVRRLSSGAWGTIGDFVTTFGPGGMGVATDAAGNLLVTGNVNEPTGNHWIVLRLPKGQ